MLARYKVAIVFIALCLLVNATERVYANGFTLEQIMSSPFPSDLIAAKQGDKVAWIFDLQGKRNLWIAEAPQFAGRPLTRYSEDDGQEITAPVFSPDGNWIAYVRGGEPNSDREIPNPTSDPAGARQEVYAVNTRSGFIVKMGDGNAPLFSPQSDRVIFTNEGHLWSAMLPVPPRKTATAAKKLFEIRGQIDSPVWSPDGAKLAFVSIRGEHSFIAIFDPKQASLRFLEPAVDRDFAPRWSPDGSSIAYIRLFNVTDTYSADKERLLPWSIRVVNLAAGRGKEVWRSGATEMDSFSQLPVGDDILQWGADQRLVFASEKDGWAHLYSISAEGGEAMLLTPGPYEVENVAWSPDRTFMVVSSNASDIDHRHLWRVEVKGGQPQAITGDDNSIEMFPVIISGGKQMAFLHATALYPLLPYLTGINGKGTKPLAGPALPKDFPADQLIEPEAVVFQAADGQEIHGQLFKPKTLTGRAPAVVFMHGGPIRQMLPTWHYNFYYHNAYALNQYLASRGYLVLSVNYRSGIGYGRAFREARHRGPRGASEYQDVVAAGHYLKARNDVDPMRIGLWGGSYGGFLTAMGLAHDSDLFAAGVDVHGVHDWSRRVGAAPWATGELIKLGRESSPIAAVEKWKSPVLLIHGDDDRNVAFNQTIDLVRRLRDRHVDFEELIFPDEIHDFLRHETWLRAYHAAADFFDRKLK